MKKLLLSLAMLPALAVNAQTVKKVMLEDFTGTWCQYCPNGTKAIEDMDAQHGEKFVAIATHNANGDPLEIPAGAAIVSGLNVTGYPNGAIDRKKISGTKIPMGIDGSGSAWKSAVTSRLAVSAIASVSLTNLVKKNDSTFEGDVIVKFNSAAASNVPIKVNVYLTENKIEATMANGLDQSNSTSWYGGGNPLVTTSSNNFYHHHTLRAAVGGNWGWAGVVPNNPAIDSEYIKHFTFTVSPTSGVPAPWVKENMDVIAFVAYDGPATSDQKEIMNVEKVKLSQFFPQGVKTVARNIEFASAYPNPANANEIVNLEYNIVNSEKVTLKVYNAIGKLVAQPYVSDEVRGTHTIMFRPSNHGLSAGIYFLELSSASGKVTQRLSVH